jgi:hypothetical protein
MALAKLLLGNYIAVPRIAPLLWMRYKLERNKLVSIIFHYMFMLLLIVLTQLLKAHPFHCYVLTKFWRFTVQISAQRPAILA